MRGVKNGVQKITGMGAEVPWEPGAHRGQGAMGIGDAMGDRGAWGMVLWQTGTRRDERVPWTGGGDL